MTNPTTPQPVQEPAGAVEAKRLADKLKTWIDLNVGRAAEATILAEDVSRLAALASPQPVTQAKSEAVAWMTHHGEPMLFPTREEAASYCAEDEEPIPLAVERQPLTPEQANNVWRRWVAAGNVQCDWLSLLRLTEAAHGIGPATQEKQHG